MGRGEINCHSLSIQGLGSGIVGLNLGGGMRIMISLLYDRLYNIVYYYSSTCRYRTLRNLLSTLTELWEYL